MDEGQSDSIRLQGWLARMEQNDPSARDELLREFCLRLEGLARKMLRRYPSVRRWVETGDVLQSALLRLLRALREVRPNSVREFFGLAAEQMRRELLDLAKHFYGERGQARHHDSWAAANDSTGQGFNPPAAAPEDAELERWCAFHEEVERLPIAERELAGLIFYHGWSQADVAAMFQVDERTVRRRWNRVKARLHESLRDA